jgi:hypothetical protein
VAPWLWRRFLGLVTAKLPSWLKPTPKGNSQGETEGASEGNGQEVIPSDDLREFRDWYRLEKLKRDRAATRAEAAKTEAVKVDVPKAETAQDQAAQPDTGPTK